MKLAALKLAVPVVALLAVVAFFASVASASGPHFTTGTLDLIVTPDRPLTFSNAAPGDRVTSAFTVHNAGTLDLRYSLTSTTMEGSPELELTIWEEAEEGDAGTSCNSLAPDAVLYGPAPASSVGGMSVLGSPERGAQDGDRALAAGASEVLCVRMGIPSSFSSGRQHVSTPTLVFDAEQIQNND